MEQWILTLMSVECRILTGLLLLAALLGFRPSRKGLLLAGAGGVLVAALALARMPAVVALSAETLVLGAVCWRRCPGKGRLCLFCAIFYEIGAGLWAFLLQGVLGVLYSSRAFTDPASSARWAGEWLERGILLAFALYAESREKPDKAVRRAVAPFAVLGMMVAVALSSQSVAPLNEDAADTWVILSMALVMAVLFRRAVRQREMEAEISRLRSEQMEILERGYESLRQTYADNARLYHDMRNHIGAVQQCLRDGDVQAAERYCAELWTPAGEMSQTVHTGDRPVDSLISSKMALAGRLGVQAEADVEFPRGARIRSADLVAVLGNLLDNALEAASRAPEGLRFIRLAVRRVHQMVVVKVENGYGGAPVEQDGHLVTSKTDKGAHGWGLRSVRAVADRYDGVVRTSHADGVFTCVVTLCFDPIAAQ